MPSALQSKLHTLRAIRHTAGDRLCDDDYRAILRRCAGVESSTQIRSVTKVNAVLDEFKRLGIASATTKVQLTKTQKKIWSLWQQLADAGMVNNRRMSGLSAFVKRQTGIESLQWLSTTQELEVIESLKQWLDRKEEKSLSAATEVLGA